MKDLLNKDYDIKKIKNIMLILLIVTIIGGVMLAEHSKNRDEIKSLNATTNKNHCSVSDFTE